MTRPTKTEVKAARLILEREAQAALKANLKKIIKCQHCNKGTRISKLYYIVKMFYISPYSCTGGDYWKESDTDACYYCPKCGQRNRMYFRPELMKLRRFFGSEEKEYRRRT